MDKQNGMGFAQIIVRTLRGTTMSVITDMISRVLDVRSMTASDLPRILQLEKQRLGSSWLREDLAMNPVTEERATWVATIQNANRLALARISTAPRYSADPERCWQPRLASI